MNFKGNVMKAVMTYTTTKQCGKTQGYYMPQQKLAGFINDQINFNLEINNIDC